MSGSDARVQSNIPSLSTPLPHVISVAPGYGVGIGGSNIISDNDKAVTFGAAIAPSGVELRKRVSLCVAPGDLVAGGHAVVADEQRIG